MCRIQMPSPKAVPATNLTFEPTPLLSLAADEVSFSRGICNLLQSVPSLAEPATTGNDDDFEPISLEEDSFDALIEDVLGDQFQNGARSSQNHDEHSRNLQASQTPHEYVIPMPDPIKEFSFNSAPAKSIQDQKETQFLLDKIAVTSSNPMANNSNPVHHHVQDQLPTAKADEQMPPEKPKRGLTAYNYFFQAERKRLLQTLPEPGMKGGSRKKKPNRSHGKIGFADLARTISSKWKKLSPTERAPYDNLAQMDSMRYKMEKSAWEQKCRQQVTLPTNGSCINNSIVNHSNNNNPLLEQQLAQLQQQQPQPQMPQPTFLGGTAAPSGSSNDAQFINFHLGHGGNNMFLQSLMRH